MGSHLQWPDYLILIIFLVISLAIGIYHSLTGGKQKTTSEFIMADRRLKVLPTAISLLVSFQSAIALLGLTAEMYCYGIQYFIFIVISVTISVVIVERIIIPWLYPLKLVSFFEYLELRYMSKSVRIFGSTLGIIVGMLIIGVVMYAPSSALESVTGLPLTVSLPLMGLVTVTYTALGGMRAVIWTDVFQFLIMIGGISAILIKGLIEVGGLSNAFRLAGEEGRLVLANFSPDPRVRHTAWGLLIGTSVTWTSLYGLSQQSVQRISAVNSLRKARITVLVNIPPLVVMNVMYCFIGIVVLAYYTGIRCDPLANKDISNPNQLLPYFVVTIFADSPGFCGLFLATLYGGALSTVSSQLSGTAANVWEDILKWKLEKINESRKALINRILVVLLGVLSIGTAFIASAAPGPLLQVIYAFCGSVTGPMLAPFILGGISRHTNWKGCLLGGIVGTAFSFWLTVGYMTVPQRHSTLPPVSTEGCHLRNSTVSFTHPECNTSFHAFQEDGSVRCNETLGDIRQGTLLQHHATELRGLENLYAISYVWFLALGLSLSSVLCFVASLILRDRELEGKVEERLLIRFRRSRCSENTDTKDSLDEKNALNKEEEDNNHEKLEDESSKDIREDVQMSTRNETLA